MVRKIQQNLIKKNSESNKGRTCYWKGKTLPAETILKIRSALSGPNSPLYGIESKLKGRPQEIVTCPVCGKTGGVSSMKHYHFENCVERLWAPWNAIQNRNRPHIMAAYYKFGLIHDFMLNYKFKSVKKLTVELSKSLCIEENAENAIAGMIKHINGGINPYNYESWVKFMIDNE